MSNKRILERHDDQVYVEYTDDWIGETTQAWEYDPVHMCACGRRTYGSCEELKVTTFSEIYSCGFVYHYTNHNGYDDNLISIKGKRIK
jgi:hypothetical protein